MVTCGYRMGVGAEGERWGRKTLHEEGVSREAGEGTQRGKEGRKERECM